MFNPSTLDMHPSDLWCGVYYTCKCCNIKIMLNDQEWNPVVPKFCPNCGKIVGCGKQESENS